MNINQLFQPEVLAGVALVLAAFWWVWRRGWIVPILSDRELVALAKVLFVIGAVLLMIMIRNSVDLPSGQFIYGRF